MAAERSSRHVGWDRPHMKTGSPDKPGLPVRDVPGRFVYFSPISFTFTDSFRAAWAAASLATGTR